MSDAQFTLEDLNTILVDRIGLCEADLSQGADVSFADLGLDSLAIVEIQLALQQTYDVVIEDEAIQQIKTLRDAVSHMNLLLGELEVAS